MRIALVLHKYCSGGAERVASVWAKGFVQRGHDVRVIVDLYDKSALNYELPEPAELRVFGSKIRPLKLRYALLKLRYFKQRALDNLKKELLDFSPDVVIGVIPPYAKWAKNMLNDPRVKYISTEHNSFERPDDAPLTPEQVVEKFEESRMFDQVTVLTQADKDVLGSSYTNITVLPNPLTFNPVGAVPHKEKVILASGRLGQMYVKGFDLLIQAWGMVCAKYPDWRLELAGTGKPREVKAIKELALKAGIMDQFRMLGFRKDIKSLYNRSSIFVLSSRYEGFGMVLTEAMSQGCACIACDFKGRQREIIENDSQGIICPNGDVKTIADAIERMITDESYRAACQKNAIERSKYYSLDRTMDRWEEIFAKLGLE